MTRFTKAAVVALAVLVASGCQWHGANSLPLPGTAGGGPGSFTVQAQLPDVTNIQENSRVRIGDVTVGNVTKVAREGWHALITMQLSGNVDLPANATAKVGQTSLLGSLHIELAPPTSETPKGHLHDGSLIPLTAGSAYPSTEQTLSAVSLLLNGGGVGQIQDVTAALSTALNGREQDLRTLIDQLDRFFGHLNEQSASLIAANESLNNLVGQFAERRDVLDHALRTLPDALSVLDRERDNLTDALGALSKFSALTADSVNQTKQSLATELNQLAPVLKSLADAGPALTRSLSFLATYPWPAETLDKWMRGDYGNITFTLDLTLSRLDAGFFTGTRFEGDLTKLELQWGRTIGQKPSPYTAGNPLTIPYRTDQGP